MYDMPKKIQNYGNVVRIAIAGIFMLLCYRWLAYFLQLQQVQETTTHAQQSNILAQ